MLKALRDGVVSRIASRHIAGPKLEDALQICEWAEKQGYHYVLSPWMNGAIKNLQSADKKRHLAHFKKALDGLDRMEGDAYLSLKLDALDYDFDMFEELLNTARKKGIRLHIDSLDPDSCELNFKFLEHFSQYNKFLGYTLPSRWKRSIKDAERVEDLGIAVRLVKGQWEDPDHNINPYQNYLLLAKKLAGNIPYIGVATHDQRLAATTLDILQNCGSHYEVEQFFSLPLNGLNLANSSYCPYRIYIAYGYPAIPYNYRFAMTRPALGFWMISDLAFGFKKPWEEKRNFIKQNSNS